MTDIKQESQNIPEELPPSVHEVAEDTLNTLELFSDELIRVSRGITKETSSVVYEKNYRKLWDGIETFHEALSTIRSTLRVGLNPKLDVLDADLKSILEDLLEASQRGSSYAHELLDYYLPENLERWKTEGIPSSEKLEAANNALYHYGIRLLDGV